MSKEILMVVDSVSNEKGVPKETLFEAVELALAVATRKRYGETFDFRVAIDRNDGSYETFRRWTVVDEENMVDEDGEEKEFNADAHLNLSQAQIKDSEENIGTVFEEQVESVGFGRIAAQTAKQVIVQKVREAERDQIAAAYDGKVNSIVSGTVKKLGRESVTVSYTHLTLPTIYSV